MQRAPAPVVHPFAPAGSPDPARAACAARLRAAAGEVVGVSTALTLAARDVGLRGAAGEALQHLVGELAGQVRGLADECEAAGSALLARPER